MAEAADSGVTSDTLLGGRLRLGQPVKGHRVGTDAVLLAAAAPRGFVGRAYDAGAGVGAVGLAVALTSPAASVTLIERDPAYAALARANVAANGLQDRVAIAECDLLSKEERQTHLPEMADLVVTNPPFYRANEVRTSPNASRRAAHVLDGHLDDWIRACLSLLSAKGILLLIHRADALPQVLASIEGRLGAMTVLAVHPRKSEPATRVLVRGIKGGRAPLTIAPPLVLHDRDRFTEVAQRLHAGTSSLVW